MATEVKCPKCNESMIEGFLLDRGAENFTFEGLWVEGKVEKSIWTGLKISDRKKLQIVAFRCSKCSILEFYAPE